MEALCGARGRHLATLVTGAEQAAVAAVHSTDVAELGIYEAWLGARRVDGTWTWSIGEEFADTAWTPSQPNSTEG